MTTTNDNNSNNKGKVYLVQPETIHSHNLFLVKHTVPLAGQDELLQGPLDQFPKKTIQLPINCFNTNINNDDTILEFPLTQRDPVGERKISIFGHLLNGSNFLFNTFTLNRIGQTNLVLVKDVMKALQFEQSMSLFLQQYSYLLPHTPTRDDMVFLYEQNIIKHTGSNIETSALQERESFIFITCKNAFVVFGAAIIASGHRLADDYWESFGKQQGFTQHHRVHKLPQRLINLVYQLKPSLNKSSFEKIEAEDHIISQNEINNSSDNDSSSIDPISFGSPYPTITEQPSKEIRDEYIEQFSKGQHIMTVMPGQSINDALELTAQFKIPKYHSKNSFLQASQMKALDVPIGKPLGEHNNNSNADTTNAASLSSMTSFSNSVKSAGRTNSNLNFNNYSDNVESETTTAAASPNFSTSKPMSRMLSNLLDNSSNNNNMTKSKKNDDNSDSPATPSASHTTHSKTNAILNINGWKFETLPIRENPIQMMNAINDTHTYRGLPIYERDSLLVKLKTLTPNQIKEIEYSHDSLFFNTGIQRMRSIRKKKWGKYWQYKTGIPIGLKRNQVKQLQTKTLSDILAFEDIQEIFNEETNTDEIHTTKRVPNANFLGYANIKSRKPPYATIPEEVLKQMRINGNVGQHVVQTTSIPDKEVLNDKKNDMEQAIKNEKKSA
ncbi:hypothetical protein C6P45_000781 [Maudiozyma exigua]|uniref:Uncharacterized protein n=1 Tax=Maudiozyma exigua TaxID=34358 RepID=A0A9P6WDI7_MAUEX|nr:hypothetical protein C6P45_000781 [Kazachstania exigua]